MKRTYKDGLGRKVVIDDEITEKKFRKLSEVSGTCRVKKVDYEKLVEELDGKFLTVKRIGELMKKCSGGKKKTVYYSEVLGALKRLESQDLINIEKRVGLRVYYHITKKIQE